MDYIETVMTQPEIEQYPPVLLDIGASGSLNPKWEKIARYCICIAFDADDRKMDYIVQESGTYRKLYTFNAIVTEKGDDAADFYLTQSPYCSSHLEPDIEKLKVWAFSQLFNITKKIVLKSVDLPSILKKISIDRIDWFKTDSQGTDLRLFKSMGQPVINKVLIAEFEPGIIDAYKGEDKLHELMAYMDCQPFWMSDIQIKGSHRIKPYIIPHYIPDLRDIKISLRETPCWAEVTYINSFENEYFNKRDFLLGWLFATLESQYGFALEIAHNAYSRGYGQLFVELLRISMQQMNIVR